MKDYDIEEIREYFDKNKYVVIRNFLDASMSGLIYQYSLAKVQQIDFKTTFDKKSYDSDWDGNFGDTQAPSSYSAYGDVLMDTILAASRPAIENYTGLSLVPTYSYWRLYQKGEVLTRHRDRHSCEISTTLCLGYNTSNLDQENFKDYDWPIYVENADKEEIPIHLKPGDMLIYKGCEIDHWRDEYIGLNHAQVFLHYNNSDNNPNMYDGRPIIAIPKRFQRA
jgi:hypothetical protein